MGCRLEKYYLAKEHLILGIFIARKFSYNIKSVFLIYKQENFLSSFGKNFERVHIVFGSQF